eukprot:maker-scaffold_35-snap-gene-2.93-mRNA-1 protein AED:0.00 eAED:0.00 QI:102/1/1/1/1/1/3/131/294
MNTTNPASHPVYKPPKPPASPFTGTRVQNELEEQPTTTEWCFRGPLRFLYILSTLVLLIFSLVLTGITINILISYADILPEIVEVVGYPLFVLFISTAGLSLLGLYATCKSKQTLLFFKAFLLFTFFILLIFLTAIIYAANTNNNPGFLSFSSDLADDFFSEVDEFCCSIEYSNTTSSPVYVNEELCLELITEIDENCTLENMIEEIDNYVDTAFFIFVIVDALYFSVFVLGLGQAMSVDEVRAFGTSAKVPLRARSPKKYNLYRAEQSTPAVDKYYVEEGLNYRDYNKIQETA